MLLYIKYVIEESLCFQNSPVPMKIIFNQLFLLDEEDKYNAVDKARCDVAKTFSKLGYKVVNIYNRKYRIPKLTGLLVYLSQCLLLIRIGMNNRLVVQYPTQYSIKVLLRMIKLYKFFNNRFHIIVHDVQSLRYQIRSQDEIDIFNLSDSVIVHSPQMKKKLEDMGVNVPMEYIHVFDYYTTDRLPLIEELLPYKSTIVFAGNLLKSNFIPLLLKSTYENVKFVFYGIKGDLFFYNKNMSYAGKFSPENVAAIKGGWGLVWDGDAIDSCTGLMGEYLRYNASHKASLFITAGIPLIVWKEAAIANWVREHNVGIVVENLMELDFVLSTISIEDYLVMVENVHYMSKKLRSGKILRDVLISSSSVKW